MEQSDVKGSRLAVGSDNVLFLVGYGIWDVAQCRKFVADYRRLVARFEGRAWAVLGDATDWNLDDLGAQDIIRDQNRWVVSHGCRAACYFAGTGALRRLLLYRLAMPDSDGYQFRVYSKRAKAVAALAERDFSLTDPQIDRFFREEGSR